MNTLKESPTFSIHEVIAKRDSYTLEWGEGEEPAFDRETYERAFVEAMEEAAEMMTPLFKPLGIDLTDSVINGVESEFDLEIAVIYLSDEENYYGCLLVTETGFEWRKIGFAPVELDDFEHIKRFCQFLNPKRRYNWLNTISQKVSYSYGLNRKDFHKYISNSFSNGFVYRTQFHEGLSYYGIGTN